MGFVRASSIAVAICLCRPAYAGEIAGPMVVSDAWPQATTVRAWAQDVLRLEGKTHASDREQALALYYWTRLFVMSPSSGMEPYEGPYGQEGRILTDISKVMFVHGSGDCDYQARALEAVWCLYKGDDRRARRVTLAGKEHTMVELFWDGAWHGFDPLNGVFFLEEDSPTANILSFAQEASAKQLFLDNEHFIHRARPFFERVRDWTQPGEWRDHLEIQGSYDDHAAWAAAGAPDNATFSTRSLPSQYVVSDMSWHLPRGTAVERHWSAGPVFYRPQIVAAQLGRQGRHYRQAAEWGPATTHWSAEEDAFNFPKIAPYLQVSTDPDDIEFYNRHSLYLVGSGTLTYQADLWSDAYLDAVDGPSSLVRSNTPPYLRPRATGVPQSVTFRVRSPYIMADADLTAGIAKGPDDSARLLLSTDGGVSWDELSILDGAVKANLGMTRFNGTQSVTGKYDYLVRFEFTAARDPATVGLSQLSLTTHIDGSLNALPRLAEGHNTVRFRVNDAQAISAPIRVGYRWQAGSREYTALRVLAPSEFSAHQASFVIDAPGLTRCTSYSFAYGTNDEDGNELPDSWEILFFGATGQDPAADNDGDGLTNAQELLAGSAPTLPDSHRRAASRATTSPRGCGCRSAPVGFGTLLVPLVFARRRRPTVKPEAGLSDGLER